MKKLALLGMTLVMFMTWAATISASTVVYTDKIAWENALGGQFLTEDFNDDQLNDGVTFVSEESGHINPAGGYYQDVLASQSQNEPMTTWSFIPEILVVGYGPHLRAGFCGHSVVAILVWKRPWLGSNLSLQPGANPHLDQAVQRRFLSEYQVGEVAGEVWQLLTQESYRSTAMERPS